MNKNICSYCRGRGTDIEIECSNCGGFGYDPTEDKPFAQCHTCYGAGIEEVEICPYCDGLGSFDEDPDSEISDFDEQEDINNYGLKVHSINCD